jgi:hypothetical protein
MISSVVILSITVGVLIAAKGFWPSALAIANGVIFMVILVRYWVGTGKTARDADRRER